MRWCRLVGSLFGCALGLGGGVGFAAEEVSLRGVVAMENGLSFCLTNPASGVSAWVKVGGVFGEFAVKRYVAESGTLIVEKGGQEVQLRLRDGPILALAPTPALSPFAELKLALGSGKNFEDIVAIARAHGRVLLPAIESKGVDLYVLAAPGTVVDPTKPISGSMTLMFSAKGEEHRRVLIIR